MIAQLKRPVDSWLLPERRLFRYIGKLSPRTFLDVDPRSLRLPGSRRSGADPLKLHRQIALFGTSVQEM